MKKRRHRLINVVVWICFVFVLLTDILRLYETGVGRNITSVELPETIELPGKRLIAVGEPTHGNKEVTLIRKEVLIRLVEEYGCRAFLLETTFGNSAKINQYLLEGQGSARECLNHIDGAVYSTKEMMELLQWIHDYNLAAPDAGKIRFYGIDIQRDDSSKAYLLRYLTSADPQSNYYHLFKTEPYQKSNNTIEDVVREMEDRKEQYIKNTSEAEYVLALKHLDCILKAAELRTPGQSNLRDQYMAENALWILEYEKKYFGNNQALLAAHNGHIMKQRDTPLRYIPMGVYLSQELGEEYYPIGLEFGKSTFWAWKRRSAWTYSVKREGWLIDLLSSFPDDVVFVDLKNEQDPTAAALRGQDWMITGIGGSYNRVQSLFPGSQCLPVRLDEAFSAILYLQSASPAGLVGFKTKKITADILLLVLLIITGAWILRKRVGTKRKTPRK